MSRTLKWVLGILAALVVIAVVVGAAWVWQNRTQMMAYGPYAVRPNAQATPGAPNTPNYPFGPRGYYGNGPMPGWGFRSHMMGPGRMFRFGPFGLGLFFLGGLLRLIIPIGLLVIVALVFYQLGKRSGQSSAPRREAPPAETSGQNPPQA